MKNMHTLYRMILLCATLPLLLGCIPIDSVIKPDDEPGLTDIQFELDQNRRQWASKMVSDYQFNFRWSCFCVPEYVDPVNISVRDNRIDSAAYLIGGVPIPVEVAVKRYLTIEGLFDFLQEGIDKNAHSISAEYHSELGYPVKASIDYEEYTVDEELGFEIYSLSIE